MAPSVMWAGIGAVLAVQLAALGGMGRRRPIGDEGAYLESAAARQAGVPPPQRFLRPPLLPWLAVVCLRPGVPAGEGESRLRRLMAAASVLAVALTAIAGWRLGGTELAFVSALLLAAQPERILLGCHIWPDTLLALVLAALAVTVTFPAAEPAAALAAGGLAALGVLIRIDFLVVPPLLFAGWGTPAGLPAPVLAACLLLPTLLVVAALSIRNYRRWGIPLPETTWAFNLLVMSTEARLEAPGRFAFDPVVHRAFSDWARLELAAGPGRGMAALRQTLRSPRRLTCGIVRRLLTLAGPDTFIRQKLLPPAAGAYPDLGERARRGWGAALRVAFPALVTVVLLDAVAGRRPPASYAWPSLGLLAVAVLFHARTRYRVAALPALSLLAAGGLLRGFAHLSARPWDAVPLLLAAALLLWALLRIDCSAELPTEEG